MPRRRSALLACGLALVSGATAHAAAASTIAAPASASATPAAGIEWREGNVEEAFAEAAKKHRPVFLYWGARWCPPCNRLKATLFQDPAFIAETRQFVAVHLDGDSAGAQRWGEYFGIAGYPTLILLHPDRREITRLSGGNDLDRLPQLLKVAATADTTAPQLRDRALATPGDLKPEDWSLLASYGWDVDDDRMAADKDRAALLEKLSSACPIPELKRRLALYALAASVAVAGDGVTTLSADRRDKANALLTATLGDPARVRTDEATLGESGGAMVAAATLPGSPERQKLADLLGRAMDRIADDPTLPISDRMDALDPVVDLYQREHGKHAAVPPALLRKVEDRASWADQTAKTPFERQAVISDAAELLAEAGDRPRAEALLTTELGRSQEPYYGMLGLAQLAEERGDKAAAVGWLKKASDAATGPATRVQWGTAYALGLIRLTPDDGTGIEGATAAVIDELKAHPDTFYQRSRMRFARLAAALEKWSPAHHGDAVVGRLHDRMETVCPSLPAATDAQESCTVWLAPKPSRAAH